MPRQALDPNFEYPLAYRLAQFLLGAGDQLGQFGQGQLQQSTSATNVLEAQGREELQRDVLGERRREADLKAKERADAAARAAAQRNTTNQFYKSLAAMGGTTLPEVDDPSSLDPSAFKFALEQLVPKPDEYTSGDLGIFSKRTGEVKVPKPEKPEPPEYVSGDLGIFSKLTGEIKTPKVKEPKEPPAPSA